ncbi:MAG: class I SAM-dependent methyltransferase [Candidatus Scalindua rubra]|nr:class I SAM-dependent methyltransferase [Candidatus Scalindua rubra]
MKIHSFGPLEEKPCPICQSDDSSLVTVEPVFGEDFHVVRCRNCRLIRTNPSPSSEWKDCFYDPACNGIMAAQGRDFVYLPSEQRHPAYHSILKLLKSKLPAGARLLDAGCAVGGFVKTAENYSFEAVGCDYSETAVAYGKQHCNAPLFHGQADCLPFDDASFDVVTMLEVLEHFSDPFPALEEIRRVLCPSGTLLIETPNYLPYYYFERYLKKIKPLYCKATNKQHLPWYPFDHLTHWTSETLLRALATAGFKQCITHSIKNFRIDTPMDRPLSRLFRLYSSVGNGLYQLTKMASLDFRTALIATAVKQ